MNEPVTENSVESFPETLEKSADPKIALHTRFWLSMKLGILRRLMPIWVGSMILSLFVIYMIQSILPGASNPVVTMADGLFWITTLVSMLCMYVDATLGMGYGTTLTPVLLILGYNPLDILPAMLVSQWLSGIAAGVSHQTAGNIDLSANSPHLKVAMVMAACAIIGTLPAVGIAVSIDSKILTAFIGVIITSVGIVIFLTRGHRYHFSWKKIIFLGLVASFNKGISGGGYGPIVTGGQILSGVGGRHAIGITALAEGLACLVGVMGFLASGTVHDISVSYPLVVGAITAVPLSAYTVRKMTMKRLTTLIASITIILGIVTLIKAWMAFNGS